MKSLTLFLTFALLGGRGNSQDQAAIAGKRVMSAGHSFHVFVPAILKDLAAGAKVKDHVQVDLQGIGGSRVIQHWDVADEKNKVRTALKTGKVDVLTLSPIFLPDEGIGNFVQYGLEFNPDLRVTVQEFWLPYDTFNPAEMKNDKVDRNAMTIEELRKRHEPYFKSMDDHVRELNEKHKKSVVYVVPAGQAVLALREKVVAGEVPGVKAQADLFTDGIGHVRAPVQLLNAYCHFAVIYGRSPVGLPVPGILAKAKIEGEEKLNRLLQELAWDAVVQHPLSGVKP